MRPGSERPAPSVVLSSSVRSAVFGPLLGLALAFGAAGCGSATPEAPSAPKCVSRVDTCKCRQACVDERAAASNCPDTCDYVDRELACRTTAEGTACEPTPCTTDSDCELGFVCGIHGANASGAHGACVRPTPGGYLVITDLPSDDPYRTAADDLIAFRGGTLLEFDRADLEALRQELIARQPHYVAWVTRPRYVEHNFVQKLVKTFISLDSDKFLDVSWGVITGSSPEQARALVARTVRAEHERGGTTPATWAEVGPYCVPSNPFQQTQGLFNAAGQPMRYAEYDEKLSVEDWTARKAGEVSKMEHSTFIAALGHGMPTMMLGIQGVDFAGRDLFPATVFTGACYTASINVVWSELMKVDENGTVIENVRDRTVRRSEINPEKSIALSMLNAGAVAFLANINTTAFSVTDPAYYSAIYRGMSLGDAASVTTNTSLMVKDPEFAEWIENAPAPGFGLWAIRSGGFILIGDPAFHVYTELPVADPIQRKVTYLGNLVRFEASWPQIFDMGLGFHYTSGGPNGDQTFAGIFERIELPPAFGEVAQVNIVNGYESAEVHWAIDYRDGKRFLLLFVGSVDMMMPAVPEPLMVEARMEKL